MSKFTLDELVGIAEKSKWRRIISPVCEENYDGKFKLGKGENLKLESAKYISQGNEIYRLIIYYPRAPLEVIYGDDANRILEIARKKRAVSAESRIWLYKGFSGIMRHELKRSMERYENGQRH